VSAIDTWDALAANYAALKIVRGPTVTESDIREYSLFGTRDLALAVEQTIAIARRLKATGADPSTALRSAVELVATEMRVHATPDPANIDTRTIAVAIEAVAEAIAEREP
jgi:hypothetical protein